MVQEAQLIFAYAISAETAPLRLMDPFPKWLTHMAGKLVLAAASSPCGLLLKAAWASSQHGGWVSRMRVLRQEVEAAHFLSPVPGNLYIICTIVIGHASQSLDSREGDIDPIIC